jgi:hypothetical protein
MRKLLLVIILCIIHGLSTNAFAEGPKDDPNCEGLTGAAFGLCASAAALGCDDSTTKLGCEKIDETYFTITGDIPPWSACPCFSLGTVNSVVYDLRVYEPDYGCINKEVGVDYISTYIITGSADYQLWVGYNDNYGNWCSYNELNIGYTWTYVVDITYEEALACRDIILNSEMWALNCIE